MNSFAVLQLSNRGRVSVTLTDKAAFTVEQPVMLTGTSVLFLNAGVTMEVTNAVGFDLNVESSSGVVLYDGSVLAANAVRVSGGTLSTYMNLSFPLVSDFQLSSAGTVNVLNNRTFTLGALSTAVTSKAGRSTWGQAARWM